MIGAAALPTLPEPATSEMSPVVLIVGDAAPVDRIESGASTLTSPVFVEIFATCSVAALASRAPVACRYTALVALAVNAPVAPTNSGAWPSRFSPCTVAPTGRSVRS